MKGGVYRMLTYEVTRIKETNDKKNDYGQLR